MIWHPNVGLQGVHLQNLYVWSGKEGEGDLQTQTGGQPVQQEPLLHLPG